MSAELDVARAATERRSAELAGLALPLPLPLLLLLLLDYFCYYSY